MELSTADKEAAPDRPGFHCRPRENRHALDGIESSGEMWRVVTLHLRELRDVLFIERDSLRETVEEVAPKRHSGILGSRLDCEWVGQWR
jgi:hypothetical protein